MAEWILELTEAAILACVNHIRQYFFRVRYGGPLIQHLREAGYQPYERPIQRRLRRIEEVWHSLCSWYTRIFSCREK